MKGGGKNFKNKEIEIPIRVVAEKKMEKHVEIVKREKEEAKKDKVVKLSAQLRIIKDKDNLPVLDGAKFYKAKVKRNNFKKPEENRLELPKKIEQEKPKEILEKDNREEENKDRNYLKKEKRIKPTGGFAMLSPEKRKRILVASVIGIVSIIFIVWVAVAKNNFSHSLSQERKSNFFEENGLKNSFQELKDKLQEFTGGLEGNKEEVVIENNNPESEVMDKLKEKVLIEEVKNKLEQGEVTTLP